MSVSPMNELKTWEGKFSSADFFFSTKSRTLKGINSPKKELVIKLLAPQLGPALCDPIDCSPPASFIS